MVMFVFINEVNTSSIKRMNAHAQQQIYPSVVCKSVWKSKNVTMKTLYIVLWLLKDQRVLLYIRKSALRILKMLQALPSILLSIV